ncbi:MAG: DNA polymerase, partial [Acidobacteriota bacterium]|nr:DNA polymerase [Acidobacteriota bacterium]
FDTLLASQIVSAGNTEDRHSLAVVAERYLNQAIDKTEQVSDWGGELSEAQLSYAARDAAVMLPLRDALIKRLKSEDLVRVAQLEFECVLPIAALELAGIFLDAARWREQIEVVKTRREKLAGDLQEMLAEGTAQGSLFANVRTDINLDSHTQLTAALKRLNVPVPDSTRNWKLQPLAAEWPVVAKLLEYRTMQKSLTSYGENILGEINSHTGRIHANFHQIGAPTGRMACTSPNIQQVPHAVEYRRCFRAPAGRKLLISDYSQIELRILAHVTEDKGFIEAFNSGADLHRVTAAQVFNVPLEGVTREQRDFAKRLNFGVVYGIGSQRFSMMTGLPLTEAESIMARYFQTYRGLDAWLRDAARKAVRERQARTLSGRLAKFNFDAEDRQATSLAQRNGKNMPIQGCISGATRVFEKSVGYVAISELAGKRVSVWDGTRFAKACVAYSGKKQLVKVELWGGHYIECSPDHKFLTTDVNGRSTWRRPSEFVAGNYVAMTETPGEWSSDWRFPQLQVGAAHNASKASLNDGAADPFGLGVWLGRLASDGTITGRQLSLLVAQHEEMILPLIKNLSEKFGHVYYRTQRGGKGVKLIHSLTLSALGLVRQLWESGLKTRIPDFAWQNSRLLAGYLRGMFDGDGTVTPDGPALCFGRVHQHLAWAREIQQALLLFGIESRLNLCADRINVCVRKKDSQLFAERIGFINPYKQEKAERVVARKPEGKIYGRAVRIKSVEATDEVIDMYDVIDSETGRFMANGMITHNSSADILKRALRLLHDKLKGTNARVVNIVHDEIVVEVDAAQAEELTRVVEDAMCAAGEEFVTRVPIKVESQIADEWVK